MALASAVAGALRPSQVITWTDDTGTALNLTNATITGKIRDESTKTVRAIAGTLTVTSAAAGVFQWDYAAGDVVTAGRFVVQFTATYVTDPSPAKTVVSPWFVHEALT